MRSLTPVTATVFAALTLLMSGCIAYDATGRMADSDTILVRAQGDLALDR
jgi:hypothetical protein